MGQTADVAIEFPVVLYNGERQISVGNIEIHPTIDFHKFRTILKQLIGVSYNNVTTYLVGSKRSPEIQSDHRKILITSKADFLALLGEKNAYFLVVMKRSRRDRRRKNNNRNMSLELSPADLFDYGFDHHQIIRTPVPGFCKVEAWLHDLQMQRENNRSMIIHNMNNCGVYLHANTNFPSIMEAYPEVERYMSRPLCAECTHAVRRGLNPEFHRCVYDEVVEGFFKTTAGPISRPSR